ncbi:glycosyl hydrolase [Tessaracoccus flavus]|uniref:glucan endo-1,3-beta-D-glucosidase n=1 Tax=Tessaracoccus flavus TaxID=1610493 RepID=A0A1Q2CIN4_9ACTN|nr:glycosyl hydrolase [Tessaracoccus flavus]AQP45910.1 hypothetical protein RPIT_14765 [Tessaracoccus flavus]SDZ05858.1 Endoglucanase Acf2 [Tessaracoccus flavus]
MRLTPLLTAVVAGGLLAACTTGDPTPTPDTGQTAVTVDSAAVTGALGDLAARPGVDLQTTRLAEGLVPPTNRWFSGLVFGPDPLPVFPMPLSFGISEGGSGFGFGVPEVRADGKTIFGGYRPTVQVEVPGATSWQVTAYDTASVTMTGSDADGAIGSVTIAQGSPVVTFRADRDVELATVQSFEDRDGLPTTSDGQTDYVAVADGIEVSPTAVTLASGEHVSWAALPSDGDAERVVELARTPITATALAWETGDDVTTTISYGDEPVAIAAMPHQVDGMEEGTCDLGTYPSVYGEMQLCETSELSWTAPTREAPASLGLDVLTDDEKADVEAALEQDVANAEPYPADTYFGGKALAREAQLWTIAREIGRDDLADTVHERATAELLDWAEAAGCVDEGDARCFFYDETNRGIVGQTPSFGSEEFNDHHFHYGYFLYAAGVFGQDDPELVEQLEPMMTLLVADIASPEATDQFPQLRAYDAYAAHSWASGTSPFADGNNQESTSEAVNAWVGMRLWGEAAGDQAMADQAAWLQANEIATALAYWTNYDLTDPVYEEFDHNYIPLNFSGKRDFATWFSPEPAAGLAIQVLPVTPSSLYLGDDPERVAINLEEGLDGKDFTQDYGDLLLAYSALAGEDQRREALELVDTVPIDNGNSRTFLTAWLHRLGHR